MKRKSKFKLGDRVIYSQHHLDFDQDNSLFGKVGTYRWSCIASEFSLVFFDGNLGIKRVPTSCLDFPSKASEMRTVLQDYIEKTSRAQIEEDMKKREHLQKVPDSVWITEEGKQLPEIYGKTQGE